MQGKDPLISNPTNAEDKFQSVVDRAPKAHQLIRSVETGPMPRPASNSEVYCWLKQRLEPDYSVTACPESGYFSEHHYHYLISHNGILIHELEGYFRHLTDGQLVQTADQLLNQLNANEFKRNRKDGNLMI